MNEVKRFEDDLNLVVLNEGKNKFKKVINTVE